jgi:hypothetical protein
MKKVILLFAAVMFSSVLWAQYLTPDQVLPNNTAGDATVSQVGDHNKAVIDQRGATGGGDVLNAHGVKIGSNTDATINIVGDHNKASITQVGTGLVAGSDIKFDVPEMSCVGFDLAPWVSGKGLIGPSHSSPEVTAESFKTVCCMEFAEVTERFTGVPELMYVRPGIYITGDHNRASIVQEGTNLLAGIQINGKVGATGQEGNKALIEQWGNDQKATIGITGVGNGAVVKQGMDEDGSQAFVAVDGNNSFAFTKQDGTGNNYAWQYIDNGDRSYLYIEQTGGHDNLAAQKIYHGDDSYAQITQDGSNNEAFQAIVGDDNMLYLYQEGHHNVSIQRTEGHGNNSWANQVGHHNQSVIYQ